MNGRFSSWLVEGEQERVTYVTTAENRYSCMRPASEDPELARTALKNFLAGEPAPKGFEIKASTLTKT